MTKKKPPAKRVKVDRYQAKSDQAQQSRRELDERWAKRPVLPPLPVADDPEQAGES